jgi:hypothetical protein
MNGQWAQVKKLVTGMAQVLSMFRIKEVRDSTVYDRKRNYPFPTNVRN